MVAKRTDQDLYQQYTQCLCSAARLFQEAVDELHEMENKQIWEQATRATAVAPVLMVPDGKLKQIQFDEDGNPSEPENVSHVSYYVDFWFDANGKGFKFSHFDIVTESHLKDYINNFLMPAKRHRILPSQFSRNKDYFSESPSDLLPVFWEWKY